MDEDRRRLPLGRDGIGPKVQQEFQAAGKSDKPSKQADSRGSNRVPKSAHDFGPLIGIVQMGLGLRQQRLHIFGSRFEVAL